MKRVVRAWLGVALALAIVSGASGCASLDASCTTEDPGTLTKTGDLHLTGNGAFDVTSAEDPSAFVLGLGAFGQTSADPLTLDLMVRPNEPSTRWIEVRADGIAPSVGVLDLASVAAQVCYCPDEAPLPWDGGDSEWTKCAPMGPSSPATSAVPKTCVPMTGTLNVKTMHVDCKSEDEESVDSVNCVAAYDAVIDASSADARVSLHMSQATNAKLNHMSCGSSEPAPTGAS